MNFAITLIMVITAKKIGPPFCHHSYCDVTLIRNLRVLIDSMFEFDLGDIDFQSFHRDNSFWVALQAARISNFNNTKLLQRFLLAAPSRY